MVRVGTVLYRGLVSLVAWGGGGVRRPGSLSVHATHAPIFTLLAAVAFQHELQQHQKGAAIYIFGSLRLCGFQTLIPFFWLRDLIETAVVRVLVNYDNRINRTAV